MTGGSDHLLRIWARGSLAGNPITSLPRVAKAAPAHRSAKDRPGPRTPALGCAMSRSRHPTTNSIFEAATKHGVDVRIQYGVDGRIASVETVGKTGKSNGAPGNGVNPWDYLLEDKKPPS